MGDPAPLKHMHMQGEGISQLAALSDLLTAISYLIIPVVLSVFIYQNRGLKFKRILVMFILFIFACGFQHLLHFTSLWWPTPRLLTGAMAFMAAISMVTAVLIWPVLRQVNKFLHERSELQEKLAARNLELESALQLANERKRALERSESAFRLIIADAPIGMAVVNLDGRFSLVNRALCDILGYKASELEKMTFQELTHPDDLDSDLFQVSLLLDGMSENYRIEKRYVRRTGEEVHAQLDVSLVRNEEGDPQFFVAQIQDITASKLTKEALLESRHRYYTLLRHLPTAVVVHRPDSSIEYANPAASALLGLSEDQLLGKMAVDPHWRFVHEDGSDMPLDDYPVMKVLKSKRPLNGYLTGVISSEGAPVSWMLINSFPLKTPAGSIDRIIVSFIDITEQKMLQKALQEQAQTDPLTGMFNRRYFYQAAERAIAQAKRAGAPLSLLLLDIDQFKQINDGFGHAFGDQVLLALRDIISEVTRVNDISCRIGGDEFLILMPDTDTEHAALAAERLRTRAMEAKLIRDGDGPLNWTVSTGVACLGSEDRAIEDLVERADAALYRAKLDGKNCVSVVA